MLLEAIVTKADLERFVGQFLPAEIALEDGAKIALHEPFDIALVPDRGVRLALQAKVHWPVMGFHVPIDVRSLVALVAVSIGKGPDGATLDVKLEVEKVDFALLPQVVDAQIQARINEALVARHVAFSWNFQETLSQVVGLPSMIQSSGAIAFEAQQGVAKVTDSALAFAVSFGTGVRARTASSASASPERRGAIEPRWQSATRVVVAERRRHERRVAARDERPRRAASWMGNSRCKASSPPEARPRGWRWLRRSGSDACRSVDRVAPRAASVRHERCSRRGPMLLTLFLIVLVVLALGCRPRVAPRPQLGLRPERRPGTRRRPSARRLPDVAESRVVVRAPLPPKGSRANVSRDNVRA